MSDRIKIKLTQQKQYEIIIGSAILSEIGRYIKKLNIGNSAFIITNTTIADLYADKLILSLKNAGFKHIEVSRIEDGEEYKSLDTWRGLLEKLNLFDSKINRKVFIVALGGGVVGDISGFVASAYKRGIPYVQFPTTLLANVDSAVGGKTAVNFRNAKNLIGAFYQPNLVFVDIHLLKSLDKSHIITSMAEIVKYGVISDEKFFKYIEDNYEKIINLDKNVLKYIIAVCYRIKADIVTRDEKDTKGIRVKLNFGHTVGHAIEWAGGYSVYKHGEAVAIGMLCAAEIACKIGMFKQEDVQRIETLLLNIGLPTKIQIPHSLSLQRGREGVLLDIMSSLSRDKKFISGTNRFILPVKIGKVVVREGIEKSLIEEVIKNRIK